MLGAIGTVLVLFAIVLFGWSIVAFRSPDGAGWRNKYLALESVACVIVAALTFGLALQLQYALRAEGVARLALTIGVFVFLAVAYVVIWRVMGVNSKLARFEATAGGEAAELAAKRA